MESPDELTETQTQFTIDEKESGLEVEYRYSGRGMYGAKCPSVSVDHPSDLYTRVKYTMDSLGLGYVLYVP